MIINEPLIKSILDQDLYTFTVGQIAFKKFPTARVKYQFINRGKTPFPDGFADELRHQLMCMNSLYLTSDELNYLKSLGYLEEDYLKWLNEYRFNPMEVTVDQIGYELTIGIDGLWMNTVMWEVPILALVSELYYKLSGLKPKPGWRTRILIKAQNLNAVDCLWVDFGTRRRHSFKVQNQVVSTMKQFGGFLGTSNVLLAMKHNVKPNGTMSHQGIMAMMVKYGVTNANREWMKVWREIYGNKLSIFLTDTFTTDNFLKDFTKEDAEEWSGLRQDSGDPEDWMDNKILPHYKKIDVGTKHKTFVFSDSLTDEKYKKLSLKYQQYATIIGGIGTFLSNDVGWTPLSIVIKLIDADFGEGMKGSVKLSDNVGKYTGDPNDINNVKKELNII